MVMMLCKRCFVNKQLTMSILPTCPENPKLELNSPYINASFLYNNYVWEIRSSSWSNFSRVCWTIKILMTALYRIFWCYHIFNLHTDVPRFSECSRCTVLVYLQLHTSLIMYHLMFLRIKKIGKLFIISNRCSWQPFSAYIPTDGIITDVAKPQWLFQDVATKTYFWKGLSTLWWKY